MSIPKLIVTPLKYFHYVDNEIFINYNHNRISISDEGETNSIYMTHVITTKIVVLGETITIKNGDSTIDLIVHAFARSINFPLTLIKLTDDQIETCKVVRYHLRYGRFRDGYSRYILKHATYSLDLITPNEVHAIYNYVYNKDRTIINDLYPKGEYIHTHLYNNMGEYVNNNKTVKWELYKKDGINTERLIEFLKELLKNTKDKLKPVKTNTAKPQSAQKALLEQIQAGVKLKPVEKKETTAAVVKSAIPLYLINSPLLNNTNKQKAGIKEEEISDEWE